MSSTTTYAPTSYASSPLQLSMPRRIRRGRPSSGTPSSLGGPLWHMIPPALRLSDSPTAFLALSRLPTGRPALLIPFLTTATSCRIAPKISPTLHTKPARVTGPKTFINGDARFIILAQGTLKTP